MASEWVGWMLLEYSLGGGGCICRDNSLTSSIPESFFGQGASLCLNINGAGGLTVVDWMMMQTGGAGMSHPASAVSQHERRVKSPHPCLNMPSPGSWKDLPLCIFIRPWVQLRACTHNGKDRRHWLYLTRSAHIRRAYHMLSAMATDPVHQRDGAFICRRAPLFTRALWWPTTLVHPYFFFHRAMRSTAISEICPPALKCECVFVWAGGGG